MGGLRCGGCSAVVAGVLIGISAVAMGSANAQPVPRRRLAPSSRARPTEELADMVMDVIEDGDATVPTTTPLPAPHP